MVTEHQDSKGLWVVGIQSPFQNTNAMPGRCSPCEHGSAFRGRHLSLAPIVHLSTKKNRAITSLSMVLGRPRVRISKCMAISRKEGEVDKRYHYCESGSGGPKLFGTVRASRGDLHRTPSDGLGCEVRGLWFRQSAGRPL